MRPHRFVITSATLLALAAPSAFARNPTRLPISEANLNAFRNEVLAKHNEYRAKHGVPPLKWSEDIAKYAKSRMDTIVQLEGLNAGHTGLVGHGENLYWSGSSVASLASGASAVSSWYDEIKSYNFAQPGFSAGTGHFTQVVWKGTTQIGCAIAQVKGSKWFETYVVCNYLVPGNLIGAFPANVPPRKG